MSKSGHRTSQRQVEDGHLRMVLGLNHSGGGHIRMVPGLNRFPTKALLIQGVRTPAPQRVGSALILLPQLSQPFSQKALPSPANGPAGVSRVPWETQMQGSATRPRPCSWQWLWLRDSCSSADWPRGCSQADKAQVVTSTTRFPPQ